MSDTGLDLELVVAADSALTIPPSALARLRALPGQRMRVHIERHRHLVGACSARWRSLVAPI